MSSNNSLLDLINFNELPDGWEIKQLEEVANVNEQTTNPKNYEWIHYTDISSVGNRSVEPPRCLSVAEAPSRARRIIRSGDTVISSVRPNRKSFFYFKGEWENAIASTGFAVVTPRDLEDSEYLHGLLTSDNAVEIYESICEGGAYPAFNPSRLNEIRIPWPPKKIRKELGLTVMNLQSKIEANSALSKTLQEIAQSIFISWFVDFEPIKAKMSGEKPAGIDEETAALFPDSFLDSELGEIPYGWEIQLIGNVLSVSGGTTPSTSNPSYWDGEHFWTTPKDLSKQSGLIMTSSARSLTEDGLKQISSGLLPMHSVLMSCRAPIGYLSVNAAPTAVNQGIITLRRDEIFSPLFILFWIRANMKEVLNRAGGATFAEITRKAFKEIPFIKPTSDILLAYSKVADPILFELESLTRENDTLFALRDSLLPRLISGELRIPEETMAS